jgi:hypothetical protein
MEAHPSSSSNNGLKSKIGESIISEDNENTNDDDGSNNPSRPDTPPILTTTNSYNAHVNSPPIHLCCYRSRHVQLCGKSSTLGESI